MTPLGEILRDEILRHGPIPFDRFMQAALYDPTHGYYRRARDPFGARGDFYTAEQIQPVFGTLIAACIRSLCLEMGAPTEFTVVELGAGRGEMATAFSEWQYIPVEVADPTLPGSFRGVVFSNEFFDALPVELATYRAGSFHELRVGWEERFVFVPGPPARTPVCDYLHRYLPPPLDGMVYEVNLEALAWLERIAQSLKAGYVFTIDYGYHRAESARFARGSLMSYQRHRADEDVLNDPGTRDITAHVCFAALEGYGECLGFQTVRFETLAQTILAAGESDQFAAALAASTPAEQVRHRMQLKNLLFGMGETFRVLIQKAGGSHAGTSTK